jgi:hypothetical protein
MSIEDQSRPPAIYQDPLGYILDKRRFVFEYNRGAWNCSELANKYSTACHFAPEELNVVHPGASGFVYLDCGAWADDANGKGTKRRNFGLVCGPHVYLCEFKGGEGPGADTPSVPSVRRLFEEMGENGCAFEVINYVDASAVAKKGVDIQLASRTYTNPALYLIMPDLHLPPASWFLKPDDHLPGPPAFIPLGGTPRVPVWLGKTPAFNSAPSEGPDWPYWYEQIENYRMYGDYNSRRHPADISKTAGDDLSTFLNGLCKLSPATKKLLHFFQLGDMFELWLSRPYQFKPGAGAPEWKDGSKSVMRVAGWALEVMIQNARVLESLRALESAGLVEVAYVFGNHDAYLKDAELNNQLGLYQRWSTLAGLDSDLFIEHGHRFDPHNYDNVSLGLLAGPVISNLVFLSPGLRGLEDDAQKDFSALTFSPENRICYLQGASLVYLWKRRSGEKPFSIYVMGHTHDPFLCVFRIVTRLTKFQR